jgi:hypothetical protein
VLVIMRHVGGAELEHLLLAAAEALAARPGCASVSVSRSPDDDEEWVLLSRWDSAGALRHGLGGYEAKLALGPLQASAASGGGVFETLLSIDGGVRSVSASDRADDAGSAGPSRSRG